MPRSSACWALLGSVLAAGLLSANAAGYATIQGTFTVENQSQLEKLTQASDIAGTLDNVIATDGSPFAADMDVYSVPRFFSFYPVFPIKPEMPLGVTMALTVQVPNAADNDAAASTVQDKLDNGFLNTTDLNSRLANSGLSGDFFASIDVKAEPAETVQLTGVAVLELTSEDAKAAVVDKPDGNDEVKTGLTTVMQNALDHDSEGYGGQDCCAQAKGTVTATNLFNRTDAEVFVLSNIEIPGGVKEDMRRFQAASNFVLEALEKWEENKNQNLVQLVKGQLSGGTGDSISAVVPLAIVPGKLYTGSGSAYTTVELQMTVADSSVRSSILDEDSTLRTVLERGIEGVFMEVPAVSLEKWEFEAGSGDSDIIARFALKVAGPEDNEVATRALGYIFRSDYNLNASLINEALGNDYNDTVSEVTKVAAVPGQYGDSAAVLTLDAQFEMGHPDYLSQILGSSQVQQRAKNVLDNLVKTVLDVKLPKFTIEGTQLSTGENSTIDLDAKVAVSIPATMDTAGARKLLYEVLTYADVTPDALNKQFTNALGSGDKGPYVSMIKGYGVSEGNTISGDDDDGDGNVDVSNGEATLYMTLVHGSASYRTALFNSSDNVDSLKTGMEETIETAMDDANVKSVNVSEGASAEETDIMVVATVDGTMNNTAARSSLRATFVEGNSLTVSNVNQLFETQYGGAPGDADWVVDITNVQVETGSEEGSTTVTADLSGVGFNETDYTEKTSAYMDFKDQFVEDVKDRVSTECGCVPDVIITNVEFASKRRSLMSSHDVTITFTVEDADPLDVSNAMSNLSSQGGTLGGATVVNVDVQDNNDDGANISHLSAACLALVLGMVAALTA